MKWLIVWGVLLILAHINFQHSSTKVDRIINAVISIAVLSVFIIAFTRTP